LNATELLFILITLAVAGSGGYGILQVGRVLAALQRSLMALKAGDTSVPVHPAIRTAIDEYEAAFRLEEERTNVAVIVERALHEIRPVGQIRIGGWIRYVRAAISVSVVLGLLGTFTGLYQALTGLSGSLLQTGQQDMTALLGQLKVLLSGMSTAFMASICGVAGSAILTAWSAFAGTFSMPDRVAAELEHYLCNQYVPRDRRLTQSEAQLRLLARFDELARSLETGLASGLADSARQFQETAAQMAGILKQVEPVTRTLGSSGQSLEALGRGLTAVTEEMRVLMAAMKVTQEALPGRMERLQQVEEALVASLGALQSSVAAAGGTNAQLVDGIDRFHAGVRQLEGTVSAFRGTWPDMMRQFVTRTEEAVEQHTLGVSESVERLREILEQQRTETLALMEDLVSANHAAAQAVAAALQGGEGRK